MTKENIFKIVPVLLLLAVVAGGVFLVWPKYQEFQKLRTELKIAKDDLKQKEDYIANLSSVDVELESYRGAVDKINSSFADDMSTPVIMNYLQKTVAENGLVLKGITEEGSSASAAAGSSFSLSVSGSYGAFKNLISSLYLSAKIFEIDSLSFASPVADEAGGYFDFEISLKIPVYSKPSLEEGILPL